MRHNDVVYSGGSVLTTNSPLPRSQRKRLKKEAASHTHVNLTKECVENSPEVDEDKPVSRQMEMLLAEYYGRPKYGL